MRLLRMRLCRHGFLGRVLFLAVFGAAAFSARAGATNLLVDIQRASSQVRLSWNSATNVFYIIQWTDQLGGPWQFLDRVWPGDGATNSTEVAIDQTARFFQIAGFPNVVALTGADTGKTGSLPSDTLLEISLNSNPSTGYTWEKAAGDESILIPVGKPVFRPGQGLGAPGTLTFWFAPGAKGTTSLRLIYHRPFDPGAPPADTFQFTVSVTGAHLRQMP